MNIDYDVSGIDAVDLRIQAFAGRIGEELQALLREAAHVAEQVLEAEAPRGETERLAGSIHTKRMFYSPGGLGGGGFYEMVVSAGEGVPYFNIVTGGSGIFGPRGRPIKVMGGNVMAFQDEGQSIFTREIMGQRPQDQWIIDAQEAARAVIEGGIHALDAVE